MAYITRKDIKVVFDRKDKCKACGGSGSIGVGGGGPPGSMSYHHVPCMECNDPLGTGEFNPQIPIKAKQYMTSCTDCNGRGVIDPGGCSGDLTRLSDCQSCDGSGQVPFDSFPKDPDFVTIPVLPIDPEHDKYIDELVNAAEEENKKREKLESVSHWRERATKAEKRVEELEAVCSEMGKIFRKFRDTGKIE